MNMKIAILVLLGLSMALCLKDNPDVLGKYKIEVLKRGSYETYPTVGE